MHTASGREERCLQISSCMVISSSTWSWTDTGRSDQEIPQEEYSYFCSCEREGAGLLLRSMMSLINGHNLLLWQKNRSEEATSFETVIKERIFTHSRQDMAEFPGASFGQPYPPSLSRNKGIKKRSHEDVVSWSQTVRVWVRETSDNSHAGKIPSSSSYFVMIDR